MEKQEEEQQEQQVHHALLSLFDTLWFYNPILFHNPPPPPPPSPAPELIPIKVVQHIPNNRRSHRRSLSDEQLHLPSSSSTATNSNPKLETILSGKESVLEENTTSIEIKKTGKSKGRYRRRGSSSTKSLSDLEFEELKGFMDLGFTFSDAETDPRLMSIVPGLRRRVLACDEEKKGLVLSENERHGCDDEEGDGGGVVRPYLSEVWEVEEERRLRNWRIPAPVGGVDMKDCLRSWAQAVASAVR